MRANSTSQSVTLRTLTRETRAYAGWRDAFEPGMTGLQVPVGDATQLRSALERFARDRELRRAMGAAGRPPLADALG